MVKIKNLYIWMIVMILLLALTGCDPHMKEAEMDAQDSNAASVEAQEDNGSDDDENVPNPNGVTQFDVDMASGDFIPEGELAQYLVNILWTYRYDQFQDGTIRQLDAESEFYHTFTFASDQTFTEAANFDENDTEDVGTWALEGMALILTYADGNEVTYDIYIEKDEAADVWLLHMVPWVIPDFIGAYVFDNADDGMLINPDGVTQFDVEESGNFVPTNELVNYLLNVQWHYKYDEMQDGTIQALDEYSEFYHTMYFANDQTFTETANFDEKDTEDVGTWALDGTVLTLSYPYSPDVMFDVAIERVDDAGGWRLFIAPWNAPAGVSAWVFENEE